MNCHWQHAEDDYDISGRLVGDHGSGGGFCSFRLIGMREPTCELRLAILGMQAGSSCPPGSVALTFSTLVVALKAKSTNGQGTLNFL